MHAQHGRVFAVVAVGRGGDGIPAAVKVMVLGRRLKARGGLGLAPTHLLLRPRCESFTDAQPTMMTAEARMVYMVSYG